MTTAALPLLLLANLWAYQPQSPSLSLNSSQTPQEFQGIGITEKLGQTLDLSLPVVNEKGETVPLSSYFDGRPVLFSLVYFSCPGLCNFHLNGLTEALTQIDWRLGNQYQAIALSFDDSEGPSMAGDKKKNYLRIYKHEGADKGWHFLTASEESIKALTTAVGFEFKWNESTKEWAHASAAIVLTPTGKISRYLHGIMFEPRTVKLALVEGGEGKIGSFIDKLVWYCYRYDPQASKYTIYAFRIMQLGGLVMVAILAIFILPILWRSRRETKPSAAKFGTN